MSLISSVISAVIIFVFAYLMPNYLPCALNKKKYMN